MIALKSLAFLLEGLKGSSVVMAFGRFNPPTVGHALLIDTVKREASAVGDNYVIFVSTTTDHARNPLSQMQKMHYLRAMFPTTEFTAAGGEIRTFVEAAKSLSQSYDNLIMVAGSDRVDEYTQILNKYNGSEFTFSTINVVSAGDRDPDADGALGMSSSKMRDLAAKGDYKGFLLGVPRNFRLAHDMFNDVRVGLGLNPLAESASHARDEFYKNQSFSIGEVVLYNSIPVRISSFGANFVVVENCITGDKSRCWATDLKPATPIVKEQNLSGARQLIIAKIIATALGYTPMKSECDPSQVINNALTNLSECGVAPHISLKEALVYAYDSGIHFNYKLIKDNKFSGDVFSNWLCEAVEVDTSRYVKAHGVEPKGRGHWFFSIQKSGSANYKDEHEFFQAHGSYADARSAAKIWARKHLHPKIYVMEAI